MSDNDDERELVLGNRQLLGIFFVATLLCGVFFAMGYVVGGNSAKSAAVSVAANTDSAAPPAPLPEGKREEPQAPADATAAAPPDAGTAVPGAEPKMADNPAAAGAQPPPTPAPPVPVPYAAPKPASPAPAAPAAKPAARTPTVPAARPGAPTPASVATGVFISVPETGASYVQVTALGRPAADDVVKTLRERDLPAILAESSKPDLYRVMVGPYRSTLTLAEAKSKLKALGFDNLIVHNQ